MSSIGQLLRHRAVEFPDRPFCYVAGTGFTFAEMDRRSDALAAGLAAHGVQKGDRVALLMPNRIEFVEAYFALAKLGAIQVPLNAFLKGDFLRHQLADSRSSVLITDAPGCGAVQPLLAELPELRLMASVDSQGDALPFEQLFAMDGAPPNVEVNADNPMAILYTSGTTGYPKGCVLPHGFYVRVGETATHALGLTQADSLFTALPMFHLSGGVFMIVPALLNGIPAHFEAAFSARSFLANATLAGATVALGVGAMCHALLATPPSPADTQHTLRTMMVAPLGPVDQQRFEERFGIDPWTEVYGQTECMPVTLNPASSDRDRTGCGKAAPDLEVQLLDENLEPVPEGEVGEICVRPRRRYAMFDGYWDNPGATVKSFAGLWYHTGDSARRLASGQFAFVDRKADVLRRKGENVSSLELEAAIKSLPKVVDAAVVAVPSESTEDDIKACVVLHPGETITPDELFEQFRVALPYFAVPRYVELLERLPVNAMNRVVKHQLENRPNDASVWDFDRLGLTISAHQRR
jgi:crotonobetaine/carnitine-CoA ligase